MTRPLDFQPVTTWRVAGEVRRAKEPGGSPTLPQWKKLNELGCLLVVDPGCGQVLTRADAAGAIAAVRLLRGSEGGVPPLAPPYRAVTPPSPYPPPIPTAPGEAETAQPSRPRTRGFA